MYAVYSVTNETNGKMYIGQTARSLGLRWEQHLNLSKRAKLYFHRALRKYGIYSFVFKLLAFAETKEKADVLETNLIKKFKTNNPLFGYNLTAGGEGNVGWIPSKETREKMRQNTIGNKVHLGFKNTPEAVERMRIAHRGAVVSEETKHKMSEAHKGKIRTEKHCRNLSLANKGRNFSEEHKKALKVFHWSKGPRAEEIKSRLSEAAKVQSL